MAISKGDEQYLKEMYREIPTYFHSCFHPNEKVEIKEGRGNFFLFHGDLSVKDNEEAAMFLLEYVSQSIDCQWVIAGLNPSKK